MSAALKPESDPETQERPRRRGAQGITIRDVAARAGVSPMTVSRVINGEANVKAATRESVADAIRDLGYVPNSAARQLAGSDFFRIGLVYCNPSAGYLGEILIGALDEIGRGGHQLILETCENPEEARDAINHLVRGGVDGLMLPPPLSESSDLLAELRLSDTAVVAVAPGHTDGKTPAVLIDNYHAARSMTEHLLSEGHRKIGFIKGHPNQSASAERYRGFVDALSEAGVALDEGWVEQGYFDYRSGLLAAERLLSHEPRPTAVFAANDDMAAAVVAVAHRMRIDVPFELSVVGFDDTPAATMIWPALTTVRQPVAEMSRAAIRLLLAEMRARRAGEKRPPVAEKLDYAIVTRESAAAPAGGR
jgi:LacI family transcriptional regulator